MNNMRAHISLGFFPEGYGPKPGEFPDLLVHDFDFGKWAGITTSLSCPKCGTVMDGLNVWPTAGRCGHSICNQCHNAHCINGMTRPGQFVPCPTSGCIHTHSFERKPPGKNFLFTTMMKTIEEMEYHAGIKMKVVYKDYVLDLVDQWKTYRPRLETMENAIKSKDSEIVSLKRRIVELEANERKRSCTVELEATERKRRRTGKHNVE